MRSFAIPTMPGRKSPDEKVTSAWDEGFDPSYGFGSGEKPHVDGLDFAQLRDEMNTRRVDAEDRMRGRRRY